MYAPSSHELDQDAVANFSWQGNKFASVTYSNGMTNVSLYIHEIRLGNTHVLSSSMFVGRSTDLVVLGKEGQ